MHDFGSTVLCCTPSYALYLADAIKDSGLPREEFQLKVGAFGAEPWTENMRHEIEEKLGIKAYDIYGLSEIAGPGVGYECECQNGTHLNEDHYFRILCNRLNRDKRANWCLPTSPKRVCHCSVTVRVI